MSNFKNNRFQFFLPMKPPTATYQEHKVTVRSGKPVFYDTQEIKNAKVKLRDSLAAYVPDVPYECAIRLMVKWLFPVSGKHTDGEYKTTKPDTDNLQKMLKDIMTELCFWKDDALVASEITEKFYADIPGLFIVIQEL